MSFQSIFSALICGLVLSSVSMGQINFDFPEEGVPVLRVDEYYSEAKKDRRPMLLVYRDGRVVRPVSDQEADDYVCTLSEEKFSAVLNDVFTVNDFGAISEETILDEVSTPRRRKRPSSTAFRVTANTSAGEHVVNFGNSWLNDRLGLGRKRHEEDDHLQRFLNVEEACRELAGLALVGGEEAFQALTADASVKFKEAYPDGPAIDEGHLVSVRLDRDGMVAVRFTVPRNMVEKDPVSVWVRKAKGEEEPTIEVKVDVPRNIHG